jgi:hypothetical protein
MSDDDCCLGIRGAIAAGDLGVNCCRLSWSDTVRSDLHKADEAASRAIKEFELAIDSMKRVRELLAKEIDR